MDSQKKFFKQLKKDNREARKRNALIGGVAQTSDRKDKKVYDYIHSDIEEKVDSVYYMYQAAYYLNEDNREATLLQLLKEKKIK